MANRASYKTYGQVNIINTPSSTSTLAHFASRYLSFNETRKAKFLLYYMTANAAYFAMVLFAADHLPSSINTLQPDMVSKMLVASIFFGFFTFICAVVGEFLEFSSSAIRGAYVYLSLASFTVASLALAHILGDMSLITGIATSGAPIAGMVLFDSKKLLHIFFCATVCFLIILGLTVTGSLTYAPLIKDTVHFESNPVWRTLIIAMVVPNITIILLISTASIVQWKRREKEATQLAQKDILTGANNRRYLMDALTQNINDALLNKTSLCVLMLDIDHFKAINDTHGHLTGDQVIIHTASIIQQHIKGAAHFSRYGGEEFCIVLPYTALPDATLRAETIRQAIHHSPFKAEHTDTPITLSVSIGITQLRQTAQDIHHVNVADILLFECDDAMYEAKQGGRNSVRVFEHN